MQLVLPPTVVGVALGDVGGEREHPDTFSTTDSARDEKNLRCGGARGGRRNFRRSMNRRAT
jgi:hypothetical protein